LASRCAKRFPNNIDACLLIVVLGFQTAKRFDGSQQRNAAPRKYAFLDRSASRVHGVVNTVLALLHLDLGRTADPNHRNAAGELGQPLLQLPT
jgi:hypothetical protein